MDDLYRDHILDHAENPRCVGRISTPTHSGIYHNHSCGDELTLDIKLIDGKIVTLRWEGEGCVISQAAASLLSEQLEGQSIQKVLSWTDDEVLDKLGLPDISYVRRKCALGFIYGLRQIVQESA